MRVLKSLNETPCILKKYMDYDSGFKNSMVNMMQPRAQEELCDRPQHRNFLSDVLDNSPDGAEASQSI